MNSYLHDNVESALREAQIKLFLDKECYHIQEDQLKGEFKLLHKSFDFYGFTIRLNDTEKIRFLERAIIKEKELVIKDLTLDMDILQNSINEVYRLLVEA
jgi:hypothetical protein